ncbi:hypothetical protein BDZ89DRAFT_1043664 [Hymenopellis radicata]|nr:hypothetical protein BDZ89DRAFT_1043664 [Hymenopellis radicata]
MDVNIPLRQEDNKDDAQFNMLVGSRRWVRKIFDKNEEQNNKDKEQDAHSFKCHYYYILYNVFSDLKSVDSRWSKVRHNSEQSKKEKEMIAVDTVESKRLRKWFTTSRERDIRDYLCRSGVSGRDPKDASASDRVVSLCSDLHHDHPGATIVAPAALTIVRQPLGSRGRRPDQLKDDDPDDRDNNLDDGNARMLRWRIEGAGEEEGGDNEEEEETLTYNDMKKDRQKTERRRKLPYY